MFYTNTCSMSNPAPHPEGMNPAPARSDSFEPCSDGFSFRGRQTPWRWASPAGSSAASPSGSFWTLLWAALVFGILNTILKPLLKLLTLPLAVFTLGIAWFFVSLLMLWLTDLIVGAFDIKGFWNYVWATIIVWAANLVIDLVFRSERGHVSSPATA